MARRVRSYASQDPSGQKHSLKPPTDFRWPVLVGLARDEGATPILYLTLFIVIIHKNLPRLTVQLKQPTKGINGHPTTERPRNPQKF